MPDNNTELLVVDVARRLQTRRTEIFESMGARLLREVPGLAGDPQLAEMLHASVEANVSTLFHVLSNSIPINNLQPTTAAVEHALRLAQRGIPGNSLRRAYHVGQSDLIDQCYVEIQQLDCTAEQRFEVLHHVHQTFSLYIDWITQLLLEVYDEERRRWIIASGNVHASLIKKVLDQESVKSDLFAAQTGHSLEQFHVGAVVWLADDDPSQETIMVLDRFVRDLGSRIVSSPPPIFNVVDRNLAWAWFGRGRDSGPIDFDMAGRLADKSGISMSLGLPMYGKLGFRRTHQQAIAARVVALAVASNQSSTAPVSSTVSFGERGVGIMSMLASDLGSTRVWVSEVLGGLACDDTAHQQLRETLFVFLSVGGSYKESATLLNLHRNSVKYRVEKAVATRGRTIHDDRLDVELALQVCQFFGSAVLAEVGVS